MAFKKRATGFRAAGDVIVLHVGQNETLASELLPRIEMLSREIWIDVFSRITATARSDRSEDTRADTRAGKDRSSRR